MCDTQATSSHSPTDGGGLAPSHGTITTNDYQSWRKHIPYLYDTYVSIVLDWPSLCVAWSPDVRTTANGTDIRKVVFGTHTSSQEHNVVTVMDVRLPNDHRNREVSLTQFESSFCFSTSSSSAPPTAAKSTIATNPGTLLTSTSSSTMSMPSSGGLDPSCTTLAKMVHPGEVNRVALMPSNAFVIATASIDGAIYIFDYTRHPSEPADKSRTLSEMKLKGHSAEAQALAWQRPSTPQNLSSATLSAASSSSSSSSKASPSDTNAREDSTHEVPAGEAPDDDSITGNGLQCPLLASGSKDARVCVWDIAAGIGATGAHANTGACGVSEVAPVRVFEGHTEEVNDLDWHKGHPWLLASVGDDGLSLFWDVRAKGGPVGGVCHVGDTAGKEGDVTGVVSCGVNAVDFSPFSEWVLGTGGEDGAVRIWDMRNTGRCVKEMTEVFAGSSSVCGVEEGCRGVNRMEWCPSNASLLAAAVDCLVITWDIGRFPSKSTTSTTTTAMSSSSMGDELKATDGHMHSFGCGV